ncbi:MAG: hypothetical protein GY754_29475 [bacterium]|nr:hypothetical protein [bacterium]
MIKKIFKFIIKFIATLLLLIAVSAAVIFIAFEVPELTSFVVRTVGNKDLAEKGIKLEYTYIAEGMYQQPIIHPFTRSIAKYSKKTISIKAINSYTVGNFDKDSGSKISSASNFLDPTSKFKDSWFGVFIIIDDPALKGRYYMLNDPNGSPGDIENFKIRALLKLPELDQMLIVNTTHQGQKNYPFSRLLKDFFFSPKEGSEVIGEIISDKKKNPWLKITSEFNTISALTDTSVSDMTHFGSIRSFVGLPNKEVYEYVDPWHPVTVKGSVLTRYFPCGKTKFWAVVYYNGSSFFNKKGGDIDTWENSDIQDLFHKMFMNLEIDCLD